MIDFRKLPNETEEAYLWRVGLAIENKTAGIGWKEATPLINREWRENETLYRDESAYRKKVQAVIPFYESVFAPMIGDDYANIIREHKRLLEKEKVKIQTEKLEYNRWIREDARDELFEEKMLEAIERNANISPPPQKIELIAGNRCGLLNIADMHFSKDFKIYGLHNEIINEYSPEIFESRMEVLFNEVIKYAQKEKINKIALYNLGDSLEGFLRNSQLWSLRYGVIDSSVIFGEYMGNWLKELSKYLIIEYHQTVGNHGECRLLDGKKNEHRNDNIEKVTGAFIRLINKDNPNFTMVENKTGLIFTELAGYNILGIHGEVKDLSSALKDYSDIYDEKIDYIVAGHKHHSEFKNCGRRKGTIGVGSIVGSDDFSMLLRKSADATASFIIFEEGKGKTDEHTFVLN